MVKWFYVTFGTIFLLFDVDYIILIAFSLVSSIYHLYIRDKKVEKKSTKNFDRCGYPKVLIQLPMYNEEAYCNTIIRNCCLLKWPRDALLIQVLDDSTKEHIKKKVDSYCDELVFKKGYPVQRIRRTNRKGYKAGAMVEGLKATVGEEFKYVAIFDADFQPPSDFLLRTIPYLENDDTLGFVQTRWVFRNVSSVLEWCQKVSLEFHFCIEQQARSFMGAFFNFNGTAGVWRVACIKSAGGWHSDTVVEDMDLSLRAYLHNWCFLYLHDVECYNEIPSTFSAYRIQQYRWLAGPMQIVRKSLVKIYQARNVSVTRKFSCYVFFLRYILFGILTLSSLFLPSVILFVYPLSLAAWESWYFITTVNAAVVLLMCVTLFSPVYLIFCIAVGYFKIVAMFAGIFNLKSSQSWVVTAKSGGKVNSSSSGGASFSVTEVFQYAKLFVGGIYRLEFAVALYYILLASYSLLYSLYFPGAVLITIGIAFLLVSLGDSGPLSCQLSCLKEKEEPSKSLELKEAKFVSPTLSPHKKKQKMLSRKESCGCTVSNTTTLNTLNRLSSF
jgi:beta-mannan synthase